MSEEPVGSIRLSRTNPTLRDDGRIMGTYCAVILLLSLGFLPGSGCQTKESHTADMLSWQSSFQAFVDKTVDVAGMVKLAEPQEMHTRLDDVWAMTDGAGCVIDCNPPAGTLQYEANRLFAGRRFQWTIPIHHAEWSDSSHQAVWITVTTEQFEAKPKCTKTPQSIDVKVYGLPTLPAGETLSLSGVLGRPRAVSGECHLAGVCVVYYPDNKEDEYGLLIVLDGIWRKFGIGE